MTLGSAATKSCLRRRHHDDAAHAVGVEPDNHADVLLERTLLGGGTEGRCCAVDHDDNAVEHIDAMAGPDWDTGGRSASSALRRRSFTDRMSPGDVKVGSLYQGADGVEEPPDGQRPP